MGQEEEPGFGSGDTEKPWKVFDQGRHAVEPGSREHPQSGLPCLQL